MSPKSAVENVLLEQQRILEGAVHNLRASLRGIGTSAEMIFRKWDGQFDDESRGLIRIVRDGVASLNNLAAGLSAYAVALAPKRGVSHWLHLPVENALQVAMAGLQSEIQETGAKVHLGALPRLGADHEQLGVLFRCLLSNALEYRAEGESPRIEVTATHAGTDWRFAVSDNGIGIPARFQRQIFEPFERLHGHSGSGLGLAICKMIVDGLGGNIWVNSQEGEGSTFFFTIPTLEPLSSPL